MKTSIAWRNVLHDKRRTTTAVAGVALAILLVFMQLGFYMACRTDSTMLYDACEFDAILVSPRYVHLRFCGSIPMTRVYQARVVPGVASVLPMYVTDGMWRHLETGVGREILILGLNPTDRPFHVVQINRSLPLLIKPDTAIMDQVSRPLVGPHPVGTVSEVNGRRIEVVADYRRGTGLIADGCLLVSDLTLSRLTLNSPLDRVQLGLVRFAPGADHAKVLGRLQASLSNDVLVWSRDELAAHEQHFFLRIKPLGFMFSSGVLVGFLVGAVILYQILAADISAQIPRYATLKAIGYGRTYLYRVVMTQGLLFAVLGFLPALVLSAGLYAVVRKLTDMPMYLTLPRIAFVLAASVGMCMFSGLLAIRKVHAADPADLF